MIRLAVEADFNREIRTESEVRICALKEAYGLNTSFIRFYADDTGTLASIMDGFCVFNYDGVPNDEWTSFLRMHTDIQTIHAEKSCVESLAYSFGIGEVKSGEVLGIHNATSKTPLQVKNPSISKVYTLLSTVFEQFSPFEQWYVDVSHRVRHGCCHIACVENDGEIVSSAMSIAEAKNIALIGGVATLPSHRGKGLATACITELLSMLPQKTILINPVNEYASALYRKMGFTSCGTWAEITLI